MPFWDITSKDLYLLLRDRRTFAMLLLLPMMFIAIIGLTAGKLPGMSNSTQVMKVVAVDATDYDGIGSVEFLMPIDGPANAPAPTAPLSDADRETERRKAGTVVVDILDGVQQVPSVEVRTLDGWRTYFGDAATAGDPIAAAKRMIDRDQVNAAIVFRPDFYRRVYHADMTDLAARNSDDSRPEAKFAKVGIDLLSEDPNSANASSVAAVVGFQVFDELLPILYQRSRSWSVAERASPRYRAAFGPVEQLGQEPPPKLAPPEGRTETLGNQVYQKIVPGYTVMFVFFLVNLMARSFLAERELGTMRRLNIAPISGWSILLGKTMPFLIVSLIQTLMLFLAGKLLFRMSWGEYPAMLLPVIFATSCAATALGLLIATLVKADSQVSAYATTAVIILAGISGCFMPRQWLPDVMQTVSLATPHAWALMAYDQLLASPKPDLAKVWQCAGVLLAFAAGFFALGGLRFRTAG